jgi:hypothetical protein
MEIMLTGLRSKLKYITSHFRNIFPYFLEDGVNLNQLLSNGKPDWGKVRSNGGNVRGKVPNGGHLLDAASQEAVSFRFQCSFFAEYATV